LWKSKSCGKGNREEKLEKGEARKWKGKQSGD